MTTCAFILGLSGRTDTNGSVYWFAFFFGRSFWLRFFHHLLAFLAKPPYILLTGWALLSEHRSAHASLYSFYCHLVSFLSSVFDIPLSPISFFTYRHLDWLDESVSIMATSYLSCFRYHVDDTLCDVPPYAPERQLFFVSFFFPYCVACLCLFAYGALSWSLVGYVYWVYF